MCAKAATIPMASVIDPETGLARTTDPWTSHAAAQAVNVGALKYAILKDIEVHGKATTVTIAARAGLQEWSVSPRMRSLLKDGLVEIVGMAKNPSGRMAQVYDVTVKYLTGGFHASQG